ncbi:hypothetical protein ASPVEDRAFT_763783 [Aspergillus versicolor CBS 583.65]|uniref:DUF7730 domain-containing protein n=1 Tax=Aspergillus versicolor CBS 583.65 TaxID=1036611 RepID=A0A1L9PR41_ASPVE|nr:uncharacterized protein ASPVEDRAFT_763783 [Aspergillus versicolor CBS 583.65]OJJ03971.1 hypothetical protein ASPVEDRAFT_763783 [Aspergillus versicolor CBS 583.65]
MNLSSIPITMENSPLLRLPVNIRRQIYHHVFGKGTVHLLEEKKHIFCVWCPNPTRHQIEANEFCNAYHQASSALRRFGLAMDNISEFGWGDPYIPGGLVSTGDVALLRVCREIHAEALPVLYEDATFEVIGLDAWLWFFARLGEKVALIRRLRVLLFSVPGLDRKNARERRRGNVVHDLDFYDQFWTLVRVKMTGLAHLVVELHLLAAVPRTADAEWCRPVKALRGLRSFELEIFDSTVLQDGYSGAETVAVEDCLRDIVCAGHDETVHTDVASVQLPRFYSGAQYVRKNRR